MHHRRLKNRSGVILDFDGTMGFLFRDYDLSKTAGLMRDAMKKYGVKFDIGLDVFDVFGEISSQLPNDREKRISAYTAADEILTDAESEAVETCEPINGVAEALHSLNDNGYKIGISTNNSAECVNKFLQRISFYADIPIVGRNGKNPELMKPDPWSVTEAAKLMNVPLEKLIFVGDTERDYLTSVNAGCGFIGLAATEKKMSRLLKIIDKEHIAADYHELLSYLFE